MSRAAIISVDGHVKASRATYRDYVDPEHRDSFDAWARDAGRGAGRDAGNIKPDLGDESQWDADLRLRDLETQGVVAEVLFPNGIPFQTTQFEDVGQAADPELTRGGMVAYNRWLADFCAQAPHRLRGQALVRFDDIQQAVADVRWAKENGLGGS